MKASKLKAEFHKRGLSVSGNKHPLKMRILDALTTGVEVRTEDNVRDYPNPEDGSNATEHWVNLQYDVRHIDNPTSCGHQAPMNRDTEEENTLCDFDENFDQAIFCEKSEDMELTRHGDKCKNIVEAGSSILRRQGTKGGQKCIAERT